MLGALQSTFRESPLLRKGGDALNSVGEREENKYFAYAGVHVQETGDPKHFKHPYINAKRVPNVFSALEHGFYTFAY